MDVNKKRVSPWTTFAKLKKDKYGVCTTTFSEFQKSLLTSN
jgi:hypothetical protein